MSKPKKITVKFFLNKTVKPIKEGNVSTYPLYILLTYNRKSTMLRSHYGGYYKDLKQINKVHYPGLLELEERIVKKTVAFEAEQKKDLFDLKGTHEKYDKYAMGIDTLLDSYMKGQLWNMVIRLEPQEYAFALNFNEPKVSYRTLYAIASRLFTNFEKLQSKEFKEEIEVYNTYLKLYQGAFFQYAFPTIIEWMDKSAVEDYKAKLTKIYKKDEIKIKRSLGIINKVVYSSSGL